MNEVLTASSSSSWIEVSSEYNSLNKLSIMNTSRRREIRVHFAACTSLLNKVLEHEVKKAQFTEYVYDDANHSLLEQGYWLLLRREGNQSTWRLKRETRVEDVLVWEEFKHDDVLNTLRHLKTSRNVSSTSSTPSDSFPFVVAAMNTTRLQVNDHLWFDLSSWLNCGRSGLYIVGSSKLDGDFTLDNLSKIFDQDLDHAPSKYFACMYDAFQLSFKSAFREEEKMKGEQALQYCPILRTDECCRSIHKMLTREDLRKLRQVIEDEASEASDEEK